MNSLTILDKYEKRKNELQIPGENDVLLSGGNKNYQTFNKNDNYDNNNDNNNNFNHNQSNNYNYDDNNASKQSDYDGYVFDATSSTGKEQINALVSSKGLTYDIH